MFDSVSEAGGMLTCKSIILKKSIQAISHNDHLRIKVWTDGLIAKIQVAQDRQIGCKQDPDEEISNEKLTNRAHV